LERHFLPLVMASLRAWASAGPYPGRLLSPRTEKTTLTRDRFGDVVETRAVSDAFAGEASETRVIGRHGDHVHETRVLTPRGERVSRTRSLSPHAAPRVLFDDLLDPRRRVLREDFLLDDLRTKTFNDRLHCGLNSRSMYLDDPLWRRPKTHVDDPALARTQYLGAYSDPLYRRSHIDTHALDHPLRPHSALDYRLAGDYGLADTARLRGDYHNDHLYKRTAYDLDDPLNRRSAYLMSDPLYRRSALDDPLYRRSALDDPLYRRSALDDPLYRRSALDDPLYGRSALAAHHSLIR